MVREEDLRATFDALHGREAPVRAFDADDVIRRGERVRRNRRTFAVAGSGFATVAAVAAALFLLPTGQAPSAPVDPARPSSVQPTTPRTTEPSSQSIEPSPSGLSTTKPTDAEAENTEPVGTITPTSTPGSTSTTTSPMVPLSVTSTTQR